jgi:autotransporter adhesin
VAVGLHAQASAQGSVALGAGSVADRAGTVSVGSTAGARQIVNVADGTEQGDAVNLGQLQAAEQRSVQYARNGDGSVDYSTLVLGRPTANAVRVQNVAAARAGTDAVNYAQLNQAMVHGLDSARAYTDDRFSSLDRQIRRVDHHASAGIASALAVAGLPQPSVPGSNMASVAVGGFNGESGVAVGISGVTEGGRWSYRLSGSTNTRGEGGFSVGAGIQW